MAKYFIAVVFVLVPMMIFAGDNNELETLSIKPIGVDYSKYSGTNKLFIVGECEGMAGNQIVVFQNRPSFDFFEDDASYREEQKELERAIWSEILDQDTEPIIVKGRWHQYNDRMVFLCHQIMQMNKNLPVAQ